MGQLLPAKVFVSLSPAVDQPGAGIRIASVRVGAAPERGFEAGRGRGFSVWGGRGGQRRGVEGGSRKRV